MSVDIAGVPVAVSSPIAAAEVLTNTAKELDTRGVAVHLVNAYSIALTQSDPAYRGFLVGSDCNLPDGKPLSWVGKLRTREFHQVRGPRLFEDMLSRGQSKRVRHYLLGSSPHTLQHLQTEISRRYPDALVVGAESPPFRALTENEISEQDERIRRSGAEIVWVGLGTPKQDFEVERIAANLAVIAVAVGAAFDFLAGSKPEAPRWMSAVGCEWVFRLATEPRRLWKRYLIGNALFVFSVMKNGIRR